MSKGLNLTGQRFGRLKVIERAEDYISPKGQKQRRWRCECDCGKECVVYSESLRKGETKSCGCYRKEKGKERGKLNITHGKRYTRIYRIWNNMKKRCLNPKDKRYLDYGGRGITVCEEWLQFEPFYVWAMANGYRDDLSIDRVKNSLGYSPENCRWVSQKVQANNRRSNRRITFNGETRTISEWSEITGINWDTIYCRLKNGWAVEKALTTPSQK